MYFETGRLLLSGVGDASRDFQVLATAEEPVYNALYQVAYASYQAARATQMDSLLSSVLAETRSPL